MPNLDDTSAAALRKPQPGSLHNLSDGELADELRGHSFAYERAKGRIEAIKAELTRRGVADARGASALVTREPSQGLLDLKRIRAELGANFLDTYRLPGSETYYKVRTLTAQEREAARRAG